MTTINKGGKAHCVVTFAPGPGQPNAGVPTDPDVVKFQFRDGSGAWSTPVTVTHDSTGIYHADVDTSTPDTGYTEEAWVARFFSPSNDSLQASAQLAFTVTNPGRV